MVSLVLLPSILAMLSWRRAAAAEASFELPREEVPLSVQEPAVVLALSAAVPLTSHHFATADMRPPRTGTYG